MSTDSQMDPAEAAAAANAFRQFVTEDFTLFAVGFVVTITRTVARVKQVGFKGLQGDDYLVWLAMLIYAAETALAYSVGAVAMGLANNGMTDEERRALSPNSPEYHTSLAWGELTYVANNLRLDGCQPAVSTRVVWVYASLNIVSDLYLLSIPIPMLWNTTLALPKKLGLIVLFSGGIFIIVCALIRAVLIVTDPVGGAQTAGSWAVRETFVAVITTNLPMVFPLVSGWVKPIITSLARSVRSETYEKSTDGKFRRNVATFGGGVGNGQNRRGRNPRTANSLTGLTFTESEERMLSQGQVKLQDLAKASSAQGFTAHSNSDDSSDGIRKDVEIAVTSAPSDEERPSPGSFAFATGPIRKSPSNRLPK
ncbi:hypothetical protein FHL15_011159 [Xylaria flabelliformis]|uniref:Rhodopsin domain-containing protein n=1 Tax=Xylaria flabelliformis TaxID=2512241 RepID=A0A553HJ20_9PEZI|nr:hypothetical protein FHL15_011159 [Xylaria flabelliformis]